jgi:hypothetical protein
MQEEWYGYKLVLYCEFCGTHVGVLDEWYRYLENMVESFK